MKKILLFTLIVVVSTFIAYTQQKAVLWSEDFEGDWTVNWHVDAGTWEVGIPTSGPNKAYNGTKCAATVLNGNYSQPTNTRLIRHSSFVVPSASENPRFRFWYWFSYSTNDWGEVQIKSGSGDWETVSVRMEHQGGDAWSYGLIDISKYAGSTVQLAFLFHSADDGSISSDISSGWYIDDVSLITGPYVLNSPEGFETGFGDWSVDEGTWELGTPTGGPGKAHGGEKCIGTNIDGNYQQASDSRLISPPFVVPPASENPQFRFWYWFSYSTNDWGEVQIKTNTGDWETISNQMNNQGGDAWSFGLIDISKYAGSTIQLAFLFHSADDGSISSDVSSGWYIDDVSLVTGPYVLNSPEGFETGFGDWSVDEGTWELGTPTGGPGKAHGGEKCIGTNIDGNYQQASDSRLISPPFVVPPASENPRFRFWYWFSYSTNDWGEVQIKTNNGVWETISNQMNYQGGDVWSYGSVDISKYGESKVQVAFLFHSADDGSISSDVSSGWYIDDVSLITGPYVFNNPEGFESGFGDWSVDEGSWEVGLPVSGPGAAHGGQYCAGTKLDGNYQQASDSRLITPPFTVPSASDNPAIRFWHWFSFSTNDWGEVQITIDNGLTWITISNQFKNTSSGAWSPFYVALSTYANSKARIAFNFHSADDGSISSDVSSGWYIDDINFDNIYWVKENEFQKLNIYPNPFSEKTTIQFDDINLSGYRLSVYNISGTKVMEMKDIRSDKLELEKGSLPAGIYIIELKGAKVYRNKIIIR